MDIKILTRRVPHFLRPKWRRFYSQEGEDIVLNTFFGYEYQGIYVDIGAHDPFAWSNTKKLAELGWWGLDIDPLPGTAAKFRKHRPRDLCLEAAIDIGGDRNLHYWIFDHEPRWNCLAPSEPVNERDGKLFRPDRHIDVPVITIAEALERAALPRVDLVNLDIEGGEEYILRHWPWDRLKPTAICVEIIGKPAVENANTPLTRFLAECGLVFASQLVSSVIYIERGFLERRYPKAHIVADQPANPPGWSAIVSAPQNAIQANR
jgi:FkbM family methyltransferase